jgi:hypothetical protein
MTGPLECSPALTAFLAGRPPADAATPVARPPRDRSRRHHPAPSQRPLRGADRLMPASYAHPLRTRTP